MTSSVGNWRKVRELEKSEFSPFGPNGRLPFEWPSMWINGGRREGTLKIETSQPGAVGRPANGILGSGVLEVETTRAGPGPWKWPGTGGRTEMEKYICVGTARLVSAKERSRVTRCGGVGLKEADGCSRYRRWEDGSALDRGERGPCWAGEYCARSRYRINVPLEPCEAGLGVGGQCDILRDLSAACLMLVFSRI